MVASLIYFDSIFIIYVEDEAQAKGTNPFPPMLCFLILYSIWLISTEFLRNLKSQGWRDSSAIKGQGS